MEYASASPTIRLQYVLTRWLRPRLQKCGSQEETVFEIEQLVFKASGDDCQLAVIFSVCVGALEVRCQTILSDV